MSTRLFGMLVCLSVLIACWAPPARAQQSDELEALREEIRALKENQAAIQKEIQAIRTLLRGRQAQAPAEPQNLVLSLEGHPAKGARDATLTLVEFSDYQCPYCGRYFRETLPQIERDYVKTGRVRYVFRNFPLEEIHKEAFKAAEAASCAGEQGRYWEMHDRLFANQQALGPTDLASHAGALGLDTSSFGRCLESQKHAATIRRDLAEGEKAGVRGTPSFFLGVAGPDGSTVKALKVITGAHPYATFKEAIDTLLSAPKR